MELKETRGKKVKHTYPDFEVGETYVFTATEPADLKDGIATYAYASKIVGRVLRYSARLGLGWRVARRTFGANVEITILPK